MPPVVRKHYGQVEASSAGYADDYEDDNPVSLHKGLWAMLVIGGLVLLAVLGITIATLVLVDDTKKEVNRIWHFNKKVSAIVVDDDSERDSRKCPVCLQPFGPCKKQLPELLDDFPCCVTIFEDKFVKKIPIKPKHRHHDSDYDGPESRWKYGYADSSSHSMRMKKDSWYEMDDCELYQDGDDYFEIDTEPVHKSVGPGEYGEGTGLLDSIKFALSPVGDYAVRKDSKIVLQVVVKAFTKLPKKHPYSWKGDHDDPRLGYTGPMLWDWDSGIAAGVAFTEKGVWTVYNRMSMKHDKYGSWHSAKRIYDNDHSKTWCIRIIYCSKSHSIYYYINDKQVYKLKSPGKLPDHDHRDMFVYRGGEPDDAYPSSFSAYLLGGTVLDGKMKHDDDHGLLKLDDYSYVEPTKFKYDVKDSKHDKRAFGQKLKIIVYKFKVDLCEKEEPAPKNYSHHYDSDSYWSHEDDDKYDYDWKHDDKKKKEHSHDDYDHDKKKEHSHDDDDDERKKEYDDSDDGWEFERHELSEEWKKKEKQKWEISNSEDWRKWGDDYEHEKSENEKHKKKEKEHYEKSHDWERGKGDDWHDFGDE